MSFHTLKKLKSGGHLVEEPKNPYTDKKKSGFDILREAGSNKPVSDAAVSSEEEKLVMTNSILTGQNSYLNGRILQQEREIKTLREDIASLYSMIKSDDASEITEQDLREEYYDKFRTDERHLRMRINKKINGTTNRAEVI